MPSRTSGCAERISMAPNAASRSTATRSPAAVSGLPQPVSGASTTVRTSSNIPAVMPRRP
jgi:hypothetical protein